jgi:hypothetical protein
MAPILSKDQSLQDHRGGPFTALRYFALSGTDHRTHAWQGEMIDRYMRWRNARAQPKRNFAAGSVIRTWTSYQTNVA